MHLDSFENFTFQLWPMHWAQNRAVNSPFLYPSVLRSVNLRTAMLRCVVAMLRGNLVVVVDR